MFEPKIDRKKVEAYAEKIEKAFPDKRIVVLVDRFSEGICNDEISVEKDSPSVMDGINYEGTIFVYASEMDDLGAEFIRKIVENRGKFFSVGIARPSKYANTNTTARDVLVAEYNRQEEAGFAKWDYGDGDFQNIIQAIELTKDLEGDFVEIGCFRGSSSCVAMRYMNTKRISRNCHFLDVFEGFDYEEAKESADAFWKGTHKTEGKSLVEKRISEFADPSIDLSVTVHKSNIITDDLKKISEKACLINLDVDLYEAVKAGLFKCAGIIVQHGIIIVEDAGHTPLLIGARLAINEFLETETGKRFIPVYMESGQTFLICK